MRVRFQLRSSNEPQERPLPGSLPRERGIHSGSSGRMRVGPHAHADVGANSYAIAHAHADSRAHAHARADPDPNPRADGNADAAASRSGGCSFGV